MASEASFIYILSCRRKNQERREEEGEGGRRLDEWLARERQTPGGRRFQRQEVKKKKKKRERKRTASFSSDNGSICLLKEWAERSDCFIKGEPPPIWFQCIWRRRHRRRHPRSFFVQFSAGSVSPSVGKRAGGRGATGWPLAFSFV